MSNALSLRQIYIDDKYFIMHSIGCGHFGDIRVGNLYRYFKYENNLYEAKNIDTNESVAIKLENIEKNSRKLKNESNIYKKLMSHYLKTKGK